MEITPCLRAGLLLAALLSSACASRPHDEQAPGARLRFAEDESLTLAGRLEARLDDAGQAAFRWSVDEADEAVEFLLCLHPPGRDCTDPGALRLGPFAHEGEEFLVTETLPERFASGAFEWTVLSCRLAEPGGCLGPSPLRFGGMPPRVVPGSGYVMVYSNGEGVVVSRDSVDGVNWRHAQEVSTPGAARSPTIASDGLGRFLAAWKRNAWLPQVEGGALVVLRMHHVHYRMGTLRREAAGGEPGIVWDEQVRTVLPGERYSCQDVPDVAHGDQGWVIVCRERHAERGSRGSVGRLQVFRMQGETHAWSRDYASDADGPLTVNRYTTPRIAAAGARFGLLYAKGEVTAGNSVFTPLRYRQSEDALEWGPAQPLIATTTETSSRRGRLVALTGYGGSFYALVRSGDSGSTLVTRIDPWDLGQRIVMHTTAIDTGLSPALAFGDLEIGPDGRVDRCQAVIVLRPRQTTPAAHASWRLPVIRGEAPGAGCAPLDGVDPADATATLGIVPATSDSRWRADIAFSRPLAEN